MNKQLVITAVLMLILGAGGGYWLANRQQSMNSRPVHPTKIDSLCFIAT